MLEEWLAWGWTLLRKSVESHLELETAIGPDGPLVAKDGSLATAWRIGGALRIADQAERQRIAGVIAEQLGPLFREPGHALQFVFERDPDAGSEAVERELAGARSAARSLQLDLEDLFLERTARLGPEVAEEQTVLVAWTRPAALPRDQLRRDRRLIRSRLKGWPGRPVDAQVEGRIADSLPPRHEALAAAIPEAARAAGLEMTELGACGALRMMRQLLNGEAAPRDWKPDIPGMAPHPCRRRGEGAAGLLHVPLAEQLIQVEPERGADRVRLGGRVYAPVDVTLCPRYPRPFGELLRRIAEARIPFRYSLLIEGGGLERFSVARVAAQLLAFSDAGTALRRESLEFLEGLRAEGEAVVALRMTFATWAPAGCNPSLLDRRRSRLVQAVEAWGEMSATPLTGDPLETICGTVPGMGVYSTAETSAAPLEAAVTLAPLERPAREADRGAHLFRTADGRLLPHDPGAGSQGLELIHGLPGRGKSVLLNALSLAWCLGGGTERLPLLATIDVGSSSSGLVSVLREALPPRRRHEAAWLQLANAEQSAINSFDTPLGCRTPGPAGRALLSNVLSLLLAAPDADVPAEGLRDLLHAAIDAAYRLRDDRAAGSEPAMYQPKRCPEADEALLRTGDSPDPRTPWWEVVDRLFEAGEIRAAELAQRYAVPVATDLISAARSPEVADLAGGARHADGSTVIDAFTRILTAGQARLPILFRPTRIDLAEARVVAVDVSGVAAGGSAEAARNAAIAYLLARQALTAGWWTSALETASAPAMYRDLHTERTRSMAEERKRLVYDEFHRLRGVQAALDQVERDVREGRKAGVQVALASQILGDFPPGLVALAGRIWTLGTGGRPAELEELARAFAFSPGAREAARDRLVGPGPEGAPVLLVSGAGDQRREALIVNALGPVELWALATTPLDAALRRRVYAAMDPGAARRRLARRFSNGTAAPEIERRRRRLEEAGDRWTEARVLDAIAAELVADG